MPRLRLSGFCGPPRCARWIWEVLLQAMKDWHKLKPELFTNSPTTSLVVTYRSSNSGRRRDQAIADPRCGRNMSSAVKILRKAGDRSLCVRKRLQALMRPVWVSSQVSKIRPLRVWLGQQDGDAPVCLSACWAKLILPLNHQLSVPQ